MLLIASGKGGVGKSSVTTNLSVALAQRGNSVAVVDADVWGFSIPRMLGVDRPPVVIDEMLVPPEAHGVRCISMGFFAQEDQPVIWRGPMLHKALEQFLTDVYWDEPDFLVDRPAARAPATSPSRWPSSCPAAEVYVVTTPQPAAQRVAQRAAFMAQKVNLEVKGIIENMSWFTGDDGKRYEIFGAGGGQDLAERLEVPLLGQVPAACPSCARAATPATRSWSTDPESEAAQAFSEIARASTSSWPRPASTTRSSRSSEPDRPVTSWPSRNRPDWSRSVCPWCTDRHQLDELVERELGQRGSGGQVTPASCRSAQTVERVTFHCPSTNTASPVRVPKPTDST